MIRNPRNAPRRAHAQLRPRAMGSALGAALLALLFAASVAWATQVTFRYQPIIGGVSSVSVAGSFNGWKATANPMLDPDKDGVFEAVLDLPAGRVEYKFVVNGDQWITDEGAADFSDDSFGGKNAVVVVGDKPVVVGTGAAVKKAAPVTGLRQVTFRYKPATKPSQVCVAGQFNDWTIGKTPMTGPDEGGAYSATLLLAPGDYTYKFVVNGSTWTQDTEGQDKEVDDGYGGHNSVRVVDDRFKKLDVRRGDGKIYAEGLGHTQSASEVNNLGAAGVEFTARAHIGDVEGVDLVTWPSGAPVSSPMRRINQDKVFEYFRVAAPMNDGETYAFRYHDGAAASWLSPAGLGDPGALPAANFKFETAKSPPFVTPDWVKNAVIYQIFPDRFRNGNPANDQDFHEWYYQGKTALPASGKINSDYQEYYHLVKDWSNWQAMTQAPHTGDHRDWMAFYGGDLAGVREKLGYLKDLGITVIYFNPLFEAKSTHKYDAADYRRIDPHFGTNEEFITLVREAKKLGIRVILDIVYNHCGSANWAFKDAVDKGKASPYYNWFEFYQLPLPEGWPAVDHTWKPSSYYHCWWGYGDLPDLNFDLAHDDDHEKTIWDIKQATPNQPMIDSLLTWTEYWLKTADVDGVRLDVPNEVPPWFWKVFNQRVKSVKPDAYIVGELWGNATDFVKPGLFDAVMNYAFFRDPVTKFLGMGQGTAADFDATLAAGRLAYPAQSVAVQMNLIDSHDTVRFLTQVGGKVERLELAALFAMTYGGAPTIYYGDEVGMTGDRDPDCRRPFLWDWDKDPQRVAVHDYYRSLIQLRLAHPALRTGDFRTVSADGMVYAYERTAPGEDFLVVINAGSQPATARLDLGSWGGKVSAQDALTGAAEIWSGTASIMLSSSSGRIYKIITQK